MNSSVAPDTIQYAVIIRFGRSVPGVRMLTTARVPNKNMEKMGFKAWKCCVTECGLCNIRDYLLSYFDSLEVLRPLFYSVAPKLRLITAASMLLDESTRSFGRCAVATRSLSQYIARRKAAPP